MKCIECNNLGYFTGVISLGLPEGHPYLQPHIERCDICQVFASDEEAKLNGFDENFKRTSLQARKRTSLTSK